MKNVVAFLPFYLNEPLGTSATTVQVRGLKDTRGNLITAMPSGVPAIGVTFEPKSTTNQEFASFTGITDNGGGLVTLTGLTRNLSPVDGSADLSDTVAHANNSECIISNSPWAMRNVLTTDEAKTITAVLSFGASPTVPSGVNPTEAVNKSQLDAVIAGDVPSASTTVNGSVRVSTSPVKTLGTVTMTIASPAVFTFNSHGLILNDTVTFTTDGSLPTGIVAGTTYYVMSTGLTANTFQLAATFDGVAINTTGAQSGTHTLYRTTPYAINDQDSRLPTQGENDALVGDNTDITVGTGNKYVTQTGFQKNAEKYAVDASGSSTAYTATLSPAPTSYVAGMMVTIKLINANTTSTPTLNINGLGAVTIVKEISTALSVGDIGANHICTFIHDGTNFVLLNPLSISATYHHTWFSASTGTLTAASTDTTGLVMYATSIAAVNQLNVIRYAFDTVSGTWYETHNVILTAGAGNITASTVFGVTVVGSFVYASFSQNSTGPETWRLAAADLTGSTICTYSGGSPSNATNYRQSYTDGTDLYICSTATTWKRYTISGTTLTFAANVTTLSGATATGATWDGSNVLFTDSSTVYKYTASGTSVTSITRTAANSEATVRGVGVCSLKSSLLWRFSGLTTVAVVAEPVTKP